jgi:hypothetical protein
LFDGLSFDGFPLESAGALPKYTSAAVMAVDTLPGRGEWLRLRLWHILHDLLASAQECWDAKINRIIRRLVGRNDKIGKIGKIPV